MARGEQRTRSGLTAFPRGSPNEPTLTSVSPDTGDPAGGTILSIVGTNLGANGSSNTRARIDGSSVTAITVVSETNMLCLAPAHAAGATTLTLYKQHAQTRPTATYTYATASVPAPSGQATIVWDTRSGSSTGHSIQSAATLGEAITSGGFLNVMDTKISWDTNVNGTGKRGFKITWPTGNHQSNSELDYGGLNITGPCDMYFQMVRYQESGFDNTQGGAGGRKFFVLGRTTGPSQARITCMTSATQAKVINDSYTAYAGAVSPNVDGAIARLNFVSSDPADNATNSAPTNTFDPNNFTGQAITWTFRFRSESAANARDGILSMWYNATLIQTATSQYTSHLGFADWLLIGGPTWNAVTTQSIEWYYDFVVWTEPF